MRVESFEVDELNIRMVARTLPGKQFDVGREFRAQAATALRRHGVQLSAEAVSTDLATADPTALA